MINDFLTLLDNRNRTFPGIYRETYDPVPYTELRQLVWSSLFGSVNSSEHFRIACELMLLLRNTVAAPWELLNDDRITYTDDDLAAVLLGSGDAVTGSDHPLTFIVNEATPSIQTWDVHYIGGGAIESINEDGVSLQVSGLTFDPGAWTRFALSGKQGEAQVLDEPPVDSRWVITRDADYVSHLQGIAERPSTLDPGEVRSLIPDELAGVYTDTPVLTPVLQAVTAAVGVVYGS